MLSHLAALRGGRLYRPLSLQWELKFMNCQNQNVVLEHCQKFASNIISLVQQAFKPPLTYIWSSPFKFVFTSRKILKIPIFCQVIILYENRFSVLWFLLVCQSRVTDYVITREAAEPCVLMWIMWLLLRKYCYVSAPFLTMWQFKKDQTI